MEIIIIIIIKEAWEFKNLQSANFILSQFRPDGGFGDLTGEIYHLIMQEIMQIDGR